MSATANTSGNPIEPTVRALGQLSPSSQGAVAALVRQLAEREGISVALTESPGIQSPAEGIPLWLAKLRAERYSQRTIHMYEYLARRYLGHSPTPNKFEIQSHHVSSRRAHEIHHRVIWVVQIPSNHVFRIVTSPSRAWPILDSSSMLAQCFNSAEQDSQSPKSSTMRASG